MPNVSKSKLIIGILLVVFCGYIFFNFMTKPEMTVIIAYSETPPIIQHFLRRDITAYYRGYNVGKVSKVGLSKDQKHINFYLEIYYKHLQLPKNTSIILKTEDLYGARYFDLRYPKHPSSELLSNGDVIKGYAAYDRLDKYLMTEFKTGKLKKIEDNLIDITNILKNYLGENNSDIKEAKYDTTIILNNLREIISDPHLKQGLKSIIISSSRSVKDINQLLETKELKETITNAPKSIDKTIKNLESINENMPKINENIAKANQNIPEVNKTVSTTNSLLCNTNYNLGTINSKVPSIPPCLLEKADCLTTELGKILDKRFLLFRLMFGKPGSSLEKCFPENVHNK